MIKYRYYSGVGGAESIELLVIPPRVAMMSYYNGFEESEG